MVRNGGERIKTQGGFLISRVHQLQGRLFERLLKESGVDAFNGPQGRILYVLWEHSPQSIGEVGKKTSLANATLTSMVDRMERAGLVRRVPSAHDRRQVLVALTERARELQAEYDRVSARMNALFYRGFDEAEIRAFEDTLKRILKNLED